MGLIEIFRRDLGLKIAAVLLAVFLWFNVSEQKEIEVVVEMPLRYINMPSGLTFASEPPASVKARIKGKGKFLRWRLKDIAAVIDLSPATIGAVTHIVSPGEVTIPKNYQVEVLEIIDPKAVRIDLDRSATKEVPVELNLIGQIPDDRKMIGKPLAIPNTIRLTGPKRLVDDLRSLKTEPVELGHLGRKGKISVLLDLPNRSLLTCNVDEIEVVARIEPRRSLEIPSVPIMLISRPGLKSKVSPDSLDIIISGGQTQVDSLAPERLALLIDVSSLGRGVFEMSGRVDNGRLLFEARSAQSGWEKPIVVPAVLDVGFEIDITGVKPERLDLVQK